MPGNLIGIDPGLANAAEAFEPGTVYEADNAEFVYVRL